MNPRYRHGPARGTHPTTHHRSAPKAHKHAVSDVGYCQLCAMDRQDTPGIEMAWWQEGLEIFPIAVCKAHVNDDRLAHPDW